MPKYTANAYLIKSGSIVKPGEEIELTKKQATRLGDKVTPASTKKYKKETEKKENKEEIKKESK